MFNQWMVMLSKLPSLGISESTSRPINLSDGRPWLGRFGKAEIFAHRSHKT